MGTAVFFWAGLACLVVIAFGLRYVEAERMGARIATSRRARAGGAQPGPLVSVPSEWVVVYRKRRGVAGLSVWRDRSSPSRYSMSVDRRRPECADCVACINRGLGWILEDARAPRSA